ncbi:MAG: hypothetical protein V4556_00785 [Bacteroidota bacterium]
MKKQIFFALSALALLASCSVTKSKTITTKTLDIYGAGVIHKPILVDLDVKETKVTGTATVYQASSLEEVKQLAVADAVKKVNCDVLVEPVYVTETSNGKTVATVTGFPATYKNFRAVKSEDIPLLQVGIIQKAQVAEPPSLIQKVRKGKGGLVLLSILAGAAIIYGATN